MSDVIQIDRITCDGHGMCAELVPELIQLDDWGYPIVRSGAVPAHLIEHARRAEAACPVFALKLRAQALSRSQPAITVSKGAVLDAGSRGDRHVNLRTA